MSHYDIDVYCKKCNKYMYSVMDVDDIKNRYCENCSLGKLTSYQKRRKK